MRRRDAPAVQNLANLRGRSSSFQSLHVFQFCFQLRTLADGPLFVVKCILKLLSTHCHLCMSIYIGLTSILQKTLCFLSRCSHLQQTLANEYVLDTLSYVLWYRKGRPKYRNLLNAQTTEDFFRQIFFQPLLLAFPNYSIQYGIFTAKHFRIELTIVVPSVSCQGRTILIVLKQRHSLPALHLTIFPIRQKPTLPSHGVLRITNHIGPHQKCLLILAKNGSRC